MDNGWIKLYRVLLDKYIWLRSTPEQKVILITLLLMANHEPHKWVWNKKEYEVQRGQFITSINSIVQKCGRGVSTQNVRSALKKFEKHEFLTIKSTNTNSLITIINWEEYQPKDEKVTNEPTENQQATNKEVTKNQQRGNKEVTTNKNDKNDKNDKKNTNNKFDFKKALLDYEFDEMLVDEWLVIRKAKKSVNSQFAFNSFISQVEKTNMDKNEVLKIVAEKQWAGFNSNWLKNLNRNNGKDRRDSETADRERQIMQLAREAGMA